MSSLAEPGHSQQFFRDFVRIAGPYWTERKRRLPLLLAAALALFCPASVLPAPDH